jgi:transcriptional regulator with XRE-family HTH domain
MNSFGKQIREIRLSQGKGLTETAKVLGITPQFLWSIEKGTKRLPKKYFMELYHYFNLDLDTLKKLTILDYALETRLDLTKLPAPIAGLIGVIHFNELAGAGLTKEKFDLIGRVINGI